jgi:hypothetical protein
MRSVAVDGMFGLVHSSMIEGVRHSRRARP